MAEVPGPAASTLTVPEMTLPPVEATTVTELLPEVSVPAPEDVVETVVETVDETLPELTELPTVLP